MLHHFPPSFLSIKRIVLMNWKTHRSDCFRGACAHAHSVFVFNSGPKSQHQLTADVFKLNNVHSYQG